MEIGKSWNIQKVFQAENEKKDNKQCLSDTPRNNGQWRKLISRIQKPYKMAKFEKQLFNQKIFFGMTHLHAHAQYIYIVNAKYQNPSVAHIRMDGHTAGKTDGQRENSIQYNIIIKFKCTALCLKNTMFFV